MISEDELDFEKYFSTPIDNGENVYVYNLCDGYIIKGGVGFLVKKYFDEIVCFDSDLILETYAIKLSNRKEMKYCPGEMSRTIDYIFIQPKGGKINNLIDIDSNKKNMVEYNGKLFLCDW